MNQNVLFAGTAIATELLYRVLFVIINRLITSFQHFASRSMEECSTWLGRKIQERRERLTAAKGCGKEALNIVAGAGKLAQQSGFATFCLRALNSQGRRVKRDGKCQKRVCDTTLAVVTTCAHAARRKRTIEAARSSLMKSHWAQVVLPLPDDSPYC
ncbi:hypothetical protein T440DRAFT_503446 [Plenodomus tracheiphilus IPT5]|uniref:Uncharacterized protein n=1 Tax=Plenodomus tracheiphilus IPT5 TaxID=1408161 RepID=A0A6A7BPH8_9PLEO|nr:hypothetical protein T440DRAFT_503446 [Plenodomus tracheiphilus IPT5]